MTAGYLVVSDSDSKLEVNKSMNLVELKEAYHFVLVRVYYHGLAGSFVFK